MKTRRKRKWKRKGVANATAEETAANEKALQNAANATPPPKPKVTSRFRVRCLAYFASQDLRAFAGAIHNAAKADDKLFFYYLAKYQRKKPIGFPLRKDQRRLLMFLYQNPRLSAEEAMKRLRLTGGTGYFGVTKQRILRREMLIAQAWYDGWLSSIDKK